MNFECHVCAQSLEAEVSLAGQPFECPSCGHELVVPQPNPAPQQPLIKPRPVPTPPTPVAYQPTAPWRPPTTWVPAAAPARSGSWLGNLILFVLLLGASGFTYAMFRFNESPQQVTRRILRYVEQLPAEPIEQTEPAAGAGTESTSRPTAPVKNKISEQLAAEAAALASSTPAPTPVPTPEPTRAPVKDSSGPKAQDSAFGSAEPAPAGQ